MANREDWLIQATKRLEPLFVAQGHSLPDVRVSCSWPSHNARSVKKRRLGECWRGEDSADGLNQIFITPMESDSITVLGILVHELSHAVVGIDSQHKGPFVKLIRAVGLKGKPTATLVEDLSELYD